MIVDIIKKSKITYKEIADNTGIKVKRIHNMVLLGYPATHEEEQKILKYLLDRCLKVEQLCRDRLI